MLIQRMQQIRVILTQEGSVEIRSLSERFGVSEKTIRQDLAKLESLGLVKRVRGGAMMVPTENGARFLGAQQNLIQKERIAAAAVRLIRDGDVVFLDNGVTTQLMARLLAKRPVAVITNDENILYDLRNAESVLLYSTGGSLLKEGSNYSYVGQDAIRTLSRHNIDIAFVGTSALSLDKGIMTFYEEKAEVKQAAIRVSKQVVCVADALKIDRQAFVQVADLDAVDCLVTDAGISRETARLFEVRCGLRVIIV